MRPLFGLLGKWQIVRGTLLGLRGLNSQNYVCQNFKMAVTHLPIRVGMELHRAAKSKTNISDNFCPNTFSAITHVI